MSGVEQCIADEFVPIGKTSIEKHSEAKLKHFRIAR